MKSIKVFFENERLKYRQKYETEIRECFDVTERGGYMWLTYNGVAFKKFDGSLSADEVAQTLNQARDEAVEFIRL